MCLVASASVSGSWRPQSETSITQSDASRHQNEASRTPERKPAELSGSQQNPEFLIPPISVKNTESEESRAQWPQKAWLYPRSEFRPWFYEQSRNAGLGSQSKVGIPALRIRPFLTSLLQSCVEDSPGSCPQRMVTLASNASTMQCLTAANCGCQHVVCIGLVDVCT